MQNWSYFKTFFMNTFASLCGQKYDDLLLTRILYYCQEAVRNTWCPSFSGGEKDVRTFYGNNMTFDFPEAWKTYKENYIFREN